MAIVIEPVKNQQRNSWGVATFDDGGSTNYHYLARDLCIEDALALALELNNVLLRHRLEAKAKLQREGRGG